MRKHYPEDLFLFGVIVGLAIAFLAESLIR
jgi:hypothetical protein